MLYTFAPLGGTVVAGSEDVAGTLHLTCEDCDRKQVFKISVLFAI